ncbi:TPA: putative L-ascorbate peroxidase 7, chloroplastic [Trebouxia sp. C0005]
MAIDPSPYAAVKKDLLELILTKRCNPLMIRLAWHDSGTYDKNISSFPERGGANGSVRFKPECDHAANAGGLQLWWRKQPHLPFTRLYFASATSPCVCCCVGVINLVHMINEIKEHHPQVSFADTFQLASALSIEEAGGPKIPLRFGRVDVGEQTGCAKEGRLPGGGGPYPDGAPDAATHLRNVFHRMGLNDQEIVVLSGAHTLGRAYPSRSGFGKDKTKYTDKAVAEGATVGGSSWTKEWLKFDNSYFKGLKQQDDEHLLVLETDGVLMTDPKFKPWAIKYAEDEKLFFEDYAKAQVKLSELGSKWAPGAPYVLDI